MAVIIDRTKNINSKSVESRRRFLSRYELVLRQSAKNALSSSSMTSILNSNQITLSVKKKDLIEYYPKYSDNGPALSYNILAGDAGLMVGDKLKKPPSSQQQGNGSGGTGNGGEQSDEFQFKVSLDEFVAICFNGLSLPDLLKKSMRQTFDFSYVQGGFSKDGIMPRLHIKKTFEWALARRIAAKNSGKKPAFLDDIDLRYKSLIKQKKPIRHAVIFMLLDASGSMTENLKAVAKKFFLLFMLFLKHNYNSVELVFVRYHHSVRICKDEQDFFESRDTGGTDLAPAYKLINEEINKKYASDVNIYLAHVTDGGSRTDDIRESAEFLTSTLLPKLQYYALVGVYERDGGWQSAELMNFCLLMRKLCGNTKKMKITRTRASSNDNASLAILNVLKELFGE